MIVHFNSRSRSTDLRPMLNDPAWNFIQCPHVLITQKPLEIDALNFYKQI